MIFDVLESPYRWGIYTSSQIMTIVSYHHLSTRFTAPSGEIGKIDFVFGGRDYSEGIDGARPVSRICQESDSEEDAVFNAYAPHPDEHQGARAKTAEVDYQEDEPRSQSKQSCQRNM